MEKPGRPRLYLEPLDSYHIRFPAVHARKARRIGDGNMAEGVRIAIEAYEWPELPKDPNRKRGVDST